MQRSLFNDSLTVASMALLYACTVLMPFTSDHHLRLVTFFAVLGTGVIAYVAQLDQVSKKLEFTFAVFFTLVFWIGVCIGGPMVAVIVWYTGMCIAVFGTSYLVISARTANA